MEHAESHPVTPRFAFVLGVDFGSQQFFVIFPGTFSAAFWEDSLVGFDDTPQCCQLCLQLSVFLPLLTRFSFARAGLVFGCFQPAFQPGVDLLALPISFTIPLQGFRLLLDHLAQRSVFPGRP